MAGPARKQNPPKLGGLWDTVRTIIYAIAIALTIRIFVLEPFTIPSGSMLPTLQIGDYIFVSKYRYGYSRYSFPFSLELFPGRLFYSEPERGDVVIFRKPGPEKVDFVKRLVGLPGDRLQVRRGILYLNGKAVDRENIGPIKIEQRVNGGTYDWLRDPQTGEYLYEETPHFIETMPNGKAYSVIELQGNTAYKDDTKEYLVPEDHFFFMGDNRDSSADSRYQTLGFVHKNFLIGRAEFIVHSTNRRAEFWEFWKWPETIRFERIFKTVE